jgi:hypothetical protein
MNLICPNCGAEVSDDMIDWSEENAFCRQCREFFDCSTWIEEALVKPGKLSPPPGTWFSGSPRNFTLGTVTRTSSQGTVLLVACFGSLVLAAFSWALVRAVPVTRQLLFLGLIPFYLLGLVLWGFVLLALFGKVEVRVEGDAGTVFNGIGRVGWKRHFNWGQIEKIRVSKLYRTDFPTRLRISLEGDSTISFAKGVSTERLRFLLIALRVMHRQRRSA